MVVGAVLLHGHVTQKQVHFINNCGGIIWVKFPWCGALPAWTGLFAFLTVHVRRHFDMIDGINWLFAFQLFREKSINHLQIICAYVWTVKFRNKVIF